MKTSHIASLAVFAILCGAAATADAQTNGPTGVSARVGAFIPTDSNGDTMFALGADYKLRQFSTRAPGEGLQSYLGVSLDGYFKDGSSNIPLALTYNVRSGNIVYHAGIGVDFYNVNRVDEAGTSLGGQVGIAYEFGHAGSVDKPIFVQANYFITKKSELSGFGVYVGYRF